MAQRKIKARAADLRMASVAKAFLLCLLVGGTAVGYVLQSHENAVLGMEIESLDATLSQIRSDRRRLEESRDRLYSAPMLERMVVHHGLDLNRIRPEQLMQLNEGGELPSSMDSRMNPGPGKGLAGGGR